MKSSSWLHHRRQLRIIEPYVSLNNNIYEKLVSFLEFLVKFDKRF